MNEQHQTPTESDFEAYRRVMRHMSARGNARKAELMAADPAYAAQLRLNMGKARLALAEKRRENKRVLMNKLASEALKRNMQSPGH